MNDYCNGIAYATGYIAKEGTAEYLVVRNIDRYYVDMIASQTGYKTFELKHSFAKSGKTQWCVKARSVPNITPLSEIMDIKLFCRAYIEIHGIVDLKTAKDRKGNHYKVPRIRIYGNVDVITCINKILPAEKKEIQHIKNIVSGRYVGKTCAIYYQSKDEIMNILKWMDGNPRNENVWSKWEAIVKGLTSSFK